MYYFDRHLVYRTLLSNAGTRKQSEVNRPTFVEKIKHSEVIGKEILNVPQRNRVAAANCDYQSYHHQNWLQVKEQTSFILRKSSFFLLIPDKGPPLKMFNSYFSL